METTPVFCRDLLRNQRGSCKRKSAKALKAAWLQRLAWGPEQQRSWDVQLWLGVFPVHWRQLPDPSLLSGQIDAIGGALNGTYSDLLVAMVTNPACRFLSMDRRIIGVTPMKILRGNCWNYFLSVKETLVK